MTLAERIRRHLEARSLSVSEVARVAGMSRQQVHRIASGDNPNPGVATVERIAGAIGVSMAELFGDEGD
jgi:transcriptional regulator with XRE-family HTH domain